MTRKSRSGTDETPILLNVARFEQPDDLTCGPTCLAQVYRYYGYRPSLQQVIEETPRNPDGGTLAVNLGISALRRGFKATIYPYTLRVFDPTWRTLNRAGLIDHLGRRLECVESKSLRRALRSHITFLELGGRVRFAELTRRLLVGVLRKGHPILTGLSATYLYQTMRELGNDYDDIRGNSVGHFVVICGYYPKSDRLVVRDPSSHIPFSRTGRYSVSTERLIPAILLGDMTYDAVLLVLSKT